MKSKMKKLVVLMLVIFMSLEQTIPTYASFMDAYEDDWHIYGKGGEKGSDSPYEIEIQARSDVWTSTPVFWKHKLTSDGVSRGKMKYKLGGYTYKVPANGHKITAKVSGMSVDISAQDFAKVHKTGKEITLLANSYTVSYDIEVECVNLVGYKEYHSFYMEAYSPANRKTPQETIIATATASLY